MCIKKALEKICSGSGSISGLKSDQESPEKLLRSPQEAPTRVRGSALGAPKLSRSPQGVPTRLLGGALGALGDPKSSPSHAPRYIHRFPSFQEPSRRSPSHDLSALSTLQSLQKRDRGVRISVEPGVGPGPVGPPDTLAHALHSIIIHWKTRSKRRCSLLTGGSAD